MNLGILIAEGNTAFIYLHEQKIYKVFKDKMPAGEAQKEADKQRYAHQAGLPVPAIIEVTESDGRQVLVMEYVGGGSLGEVFLNGHKSAETVMTIKADVQAKLHAIHIPELESMTKKLERQIRSVSLFSQQKTTDLVTKLKELSFEPRLCHGDFHLHNLIDAGGRTVILDWVDATSGDPLADVYRSYLLTSQHSEELGQLYVDKYCERTGVSKAAVFEWAPIIAAARLAENVESENVERLLKITATI